MALHAPFAKQKSFKYEKQRKSSCMEMIYSKLFGTRNTVADMSTVNESDTLEEGLVTVEAAPTGTVSEIVIKNGTGDEADHHLGLLLTSVPREEGQLMFYRHVLTSNTNGPGNQLNIKNGDEIIMFGENFVLTTSHEDLLKQFYNLKVDGQSTFVMMIRRKRKSGKWKWLKMFATLSSCSGCCELTVKKATHRQMEIESDHMYKVPGTQLYVQIDNSGLRANILSGDSGDKTKVICKRTIFCEDDNGPRIEVTLRDKILGRHISFCVENQQIILSDTPHHFKYSLLEDKAHFMTTEGNFLGFDYDAHKMRLQSKKFAFEELPVDDYLQ